MSLLKADCSRCCGLCCFAPAYLQEQGFPFDKPAERACPKTTAALVAPPGDGAALRVGVGIPNCPGGFEIAPLIAGRTDRESWSVVWAP